MNWIGMRTLFYKEIRRFLRVPGQTVFQPLVSAMLYLLVFGVSRRGEGSMNVDAMIPGLVFLSASSNAFLNTSSSMFIAKIQGTFVDLLVAPLSAKELLGGFVTGAMVRGIFVAFITWLAALPFGTGIHLLHPAETILLLLLTTYLFGMLGLLTGIWAEKFEHINAFSTFLLLPLTFLGGVFYSVRTLPEPWRSVSLANPIVHIVDGLRAAMLGTDTVSFAGIGVMLLVSVLATVVTYRLMESGYRLKS